MNIFSAVPVHNAYQKMKQNIMETTGIGVIDDGSVILRYSTKERHRSISASQILGECFDADLLTEMLSAHISEEHAENIQGLIMEVIYSDRNLENIQKVIDGFDEEGYENEIQLDNLHKHIESIQDPMEKDILTELYMKFDIDALKLQARGRLNDRQ